MTVEGETVSLC